MKFRIDYTILRRESSGGEFTEIGFGTSGSHADVDAALYTVQSDVQNRLWETDDEMPDPSDVDVTP